MSESKKRWGLDDWLAVITVCAIVVITIAAVFTRYVLNNPLQWVEEILIALFIWAIMLGATSAMKADEHVSIDAFVSILPKKGQYFFRVINRVLTIVILLAFGYLGLQLSLEASEKLTPILGIKYMYLDIAVPLGAFWMILHSLRSLIRDLKNPSRDTNEDDPPECCT